MEPYLNDPAILAWDVVNEPFDNHDLLDLLGERVMVDWFAAARATDPAPKLFINDYAILSGGGGTTPHRDHYEKTIEKLIAAGHPHVVNVEGGTLAWEEAGLPVVRGQKAMSLERQVRIAAGALVFVGTLLGALVHPYWLVIPAFVGAGLVFAGVTDTCGMAMVLAPALTTAAADREIACWAFQLMAPVVVTAWLSVMVPPVIVKSPTSPPLLARVTGPLRVTLPNGTRME